MRKRASVSLPRLINLSQSGHSLSVLQCTRWLHWLLQHCSKLVNDPEMSHEVCFGVRGLFTKVTIFINPCRVNKGQEACLATTILADNVRRMLRTGAPVVITQEMDGVPENMYSIIKWGLVYFDHSFLATAAGTDWCHQVSF